VGRRTVMSRLARLQLRIAVCEVAAVTKAAAVRRRKARAQHRLGIFRCPAEAAVLAMSAMVAHGVRTLYLLCQLTAARYLWDSPRAVALNRSGPTLAA
jgi:hypothetical protein